MPRDDDRDVESGPQHPGRHNEPDVLLDVTELRVDEISLEVEDLTARVSLQANVLDLLRLHVGVDAALGGVQLTIKGVEAQVLLKARLDNVARIIDRVLTTIDNNPEIIGQLTEPLGEAVAEVGAGTGEVVDDVVTGAAIATNIGRGIAVVVQLWMLSSGRSRVHLTRRHIELVPAVMWNVCRLSGSGFLQVLIDTSSYMGLVRVIATFGSDVLAGYTIGIRTVIFAILPAWGLSNAAATMVGQALGAGKPDRAEQSVWTAGKYNAVVLGIVGLVFFIFAPQIAAFFTSDPRVAPHATSCLRIVSTGFVFFAYGLVFTQSFNGAGDTWTPTWINLGCFWAFQIPLAWLLAIRMEMGPIGVFIAMTVAFSLLAVVSGVIFRRGWWKTRTV